MPGTLLRGLDSLFPLILSTSYVVGAIINLILKQLKKLNEGAFHGGRKGEREEKGGGRLPGFTNKTQDATFEFQINND